MEEDSSNGSFQGWCQVGWFRLAGALAKVLI